MKDININEILIAELEELKGKTLSYLVSKDEKYKELLTEQEDAEKAYSKLDLSREQKEVIDSLLYFTDELDMEYSILSYLAGAYDSEKVIKASTLNKGGDSGLEDRFPFTVKKRSSMDTLRELYVVSSELQETEEALKESDKQFFDYMNSNVPTEEKTIFFDTMNSIFRAREEYFFRTGFKTGVKLLLESL